ncbi:MAG: hypothetical protein ACYDD4_09660 [Acidimicrobiales bacterium]
MEDVVRRADSRPDADPPAGRGGSGVRGNARLTASTAAVLLVLLAAEGVTLVGIRQHLSLHIFLGMVLVPPVALKMASTAYRFVRYYAGSPEYRRKGPPPPLLRLLGPFVVALTVLLFASGIALLALHGHWYRRMVFVHKASFVLWFGAMTVHVLGHVIETGRLGLRDWTRRTRSAVPGAGLRQWLLVASVALGIPLGLLFMGGARPLP